MTKLVDLTGQRFGLLRVLCKGPTGPKTQWLCQCDCGTERLFLAGNLRQGFSRSCGCAKPTFIRKTRPGRDLAGQVFGRLTIIERAAPIYYGNQAVKRWLCHCACGRDSTVREGALLSGHTRSCPHHAGEHSKKHGMSGSPEASCFKSMVARCENPNNTRWKYYGGRGIKVCDKWRHNFLAFLADVGPRPSLHHSLDRKDPDGSYEPGNVQWATPVEQAQNKRIVIAAKRVPELEARIAELQTQLRHKLFHEDLSEEELTTREAELHEYRKQRWASGHLIATQGK